MKLNRGEVAEAEVSVYSEGERVERHLGGVRRFGLVPEMH